MIFQKNSEFRLILHSGENSPAERLRNCWRAVEYTPTFWSMEYRTQEPLQKIHTLQCTLHFPHFGCMIFQKIKSSAIKFRKSLFFYCLLLCIKTYSKLWGHFPLFWSVFRSGSTPESKLECTFQNTKNFLARAAAENTPENGGVSNCLLIKA